MATQTIEIAWNANTGYSITSQPTSMLQGDTLNVVPPTEGCTVNFGPYPIPLSGTTSPTYLSYTLGGQMKAFTIANVPPGQNSYNFTFSVDGRNGKSGADGRSVPVNKTGL
jgi:hypothetical protein